MPFWALLQAPAERARAHGCSGLPCGSWQLFQVEPKVRPEEMPIVARVHRATSSFGRHVNLLTECYYNLVPTAPGRVQRTIVHVLIGAVDSRVWLDAKIGSNRAP